MPTITKSIIYIISFPFVIKLWCNPFTTAANPLNYPAVSPAPSLGILFFLLAPVFILNTGLEVELLAQVLVIVF